MNKKISSNKRTNRMAVAAWRGKVRRGGGDGGAYVQ